MKNCSACGHEYGYVNVGTPDQREILHICVPLQSKEINDGGKRKEDHVDAGGTDHCGNTVNPSEEGGFFIVGEAKGPSGIGSDVASSGTSPTDSKQLIGVTDSSESEFFNPGLGIPYPELELGSSTEGVLYERTVFDKPVTVRNGDTLSIGGFEVSVNGVVVGTCKSFRVSNGKLLNEKVLDADGKLVGYQINGETVSFGDHVQRIKKAFTRIRPSPFANPFTGKAADLASKGIGPANPFAGIYADLTSKGIGPGNPDIYQGANTSTLLSPTPEELIQGIAEVKQRLEGRAVERILSDAFTTARAFLTSLGIHRREAFIRTVCQGASPETVAFLRKLVEPQFDEVNHWVTPWESRFKRIQPGGWFEMHNELPSWPTKQELDAAAKLSADWANLKAGVAPGVPYAKAPPVGDDIRPCFTVTSKETK